MRTLRRVAATIGLTALAVAGRGGHVPGPYANFGLRGYVYVNDNTTAAFGGNKVVAFSENQDGTLSPIPGLPFNVGGAGLPALNVIRVHDGYLLEALTSPIALPAAGAPSGPVVSPSF